MTRVFAERSSATYLEARYSGQIDEDCYTKLIKALKLEGILYTGKQGGDISPLVYTRKQR